MPQKIYLDTVEGVVEHIVSDPSDRRVYVEQTSDVTHNIEWNKREYNVNRRGREGLGDKVADIPIGVVLLWKKLYGLDFYNRDHWQAILKKLDDPDHRHLRTTPGRLT